MEKFSRKVSWKNKTRYRHINILEVKAVWLALQHFLEPLKVPTLRADNTTVVFYVNQ